MEALAAGPVMGAPTGSDALAFTIAICTHNRARHLEQNLAALVEQPGIGGDTEVLVVNNASTDATAEVAAAWATQHPFIRVLYEPEPGLSHARNAALRASAADYLVYVDDDATVEPGWLDGLRRGVRALGATPGAVGGPIYPLFETPPPPWFDPASVVRAQRQEAGPLGEMEAMFGFPGGNMAIARVLLEELGGFDPELGMRPGRALFSEDTDFFVRLYRRFGNRTYYVPKMALRHVEMAEKQRPGYVARRTFMTAAKYPELAVYALGRPRGAALAVGKAVKRAGQTLVAIPAAPFRRHGLFRLARHAVTAAGTVWGLGRLLRGEGRG